MATRSILISGAGIAGSTLALWLQRYGMHAVVVERAPSLRMGGQTVDIRGAGREVVRRMGIEDLVRSRTTREEGLAFVDGTNRTWVAMGMADFEGRGFVAEIEILRSELATLLYEQTRAHSEYVFGDSVAHVAESDSEVEVTFASGRTRRFDLLVAADGMRSKTRDLVFGGASPILPLGQCTAYFTIPFEPADGTWARWYNAPGARCMMLRPDNLGTTRACLSFITAPRGYDRLDGASQRRLMHEVFGRAGWEAPRVLAGMDASSDFYLEEIGQVKMPRWSQGRVALVGDAAYCASPISGMGTSLAMIGAYILAGELARHDDHAQAFASYEQLMRPIVDRAQKLPPGAPRIASPRTRLGIGLLYGALRVAAHPRVRKVLSRLVPPDRGTGLPAPPPA